MQPRAGHLLCVVVAAAGAFLGGCGSIGYEYSPRQDASAGGAGKHAEGDDVRMDAAMELITKLQYAEAAGMLEKVVFRDRRPVVASSVGDGRGNVEAMFWLAFCREKTGALGEAAELYAAVLAVAPDTKYARQAKMRRRRVLQRMTSTPGSAD
ncbi:MAG: tetratricopeptide repeat protein [Planctomycetota bacterium]